LLARAILARPAQLLAHLGHAAHPLRFHAGAVLVGQVGRERDTEQGDDRLFRAWQ
jgi:hypothetical protein